MKAGQSRRDADPQPKNAETQSQRKPASAMTPTVAPAEAAGISMDRNAPPTIDMAITATSPSARIAPTGVRSACIMDRAPHGGPSSSTAPVRSDGQGGGGEARRR